MQKIIFLTLFFIAVMFANIVNAQVPIVYYDFENNTHSAIQTNPEAFANTSSGITAALNFSNTGLSGNNGSGNGIAYGGSIAGFALGYSGFTTGASSGSAASINYAFFDVTGFSNLTVSLDAIRADANAPNNVDVYWSNDGITYTATTNSSNTITTSGYTSLNFTLPAAVDNSASLYLKIVGYNSGTTGGIMKIDNLTILSNTYTDASNDLILLSAVTQGTGLSSGGAFFPTYTNFTINAGSSSVTTKSNITFNGTLALTNGNFILGNNISNTYTLTFIDADTPITLSSGFLYINNRSNLTFGAAGHTGGNAFTFPSALLYNTSFANFTINRDNSLSVSDQSLTLSGNLVLTKGLLNDNGQQITVSGNITGTNGSHVSGVSGKIIMSGTGAKTIDASGFGNLELNNASGFTLGGSTIFSGTLSLTNGVLAVGTNTITFHTDNIPIQRISGTIALAASSNLVFGTVGNLGGNSFNIPNNLFTTAPSFNSFTINRTNQLTLGNQNITFSGNLNLTAGTLDDGGQTILVGGNITGTGTHISSPGGKINMTGSGSTISGATLGNVELNNAGGFALSASPTITGTLTLTNGALSVGSNTLTFQTGNTPISVGAGSITLSTASNLVFGTTGNTSGTAFAIPNNTFTSAPDFNNLNINRTNSLTLNNQNTSLRGKLNLTSGTLLLPSNYTFTLKSTSITNTALVDVVGASANIGYGTGANFLIERFIPQGNRAYRFLSPSVNSGSATFFNTWQENGDTTSIYGTQITGKIGTTNATDATTGLDMTQTGASSLYTYNITTGNYDAYTHTNQSTDTLSALKGYLAVIKGNRHHNLGTDVATTNADVILRSKGKLAIGNVSMTTSASTVNGVSNSNIKLSSDPVGGTLIGNPYAAPIVWDSLVNRSTGLEANYYAFDPTINTSGAYVTYNVSGTSSNGASNVNKFIQPGQSFFVANNNNSSPTLLISETHKAATSSNLTAIFGDNSVPVSKIIFGINKLVNGTYINADGATAYFNNSFSNSSGREDATKFSNYPNEDIGINNNNDILSIDGRKIPTITDTISLNIKQFKTGTNYQLKIDLTNFLANGLQAFLVDKFSNTRTMLTMGSNNNYPFVTSSNASSFNNRFNIVYQQTILPIDFISLKAYSTNSGVMVDWITQESNTDFYDVEYSTNGQTFIKIATIKASGSSLNSVQNYNYNHTTPQNGNNYYRIKSVDISGSIKYSSVVLVAISNTTTTSITVYPNPIKNGKVTVQFNNISKGTYNIYISNVIGQAIYSTVQYHNGGSSSYQLLLPKSVTKGTYQLNIGNDAFNKTEKVLVE